MALSQKLQMRQGQSLVMTPQLQQAIKLLQMSNFELQAFVESELESNPLLERDERDEAGRDITADDGFEPGAAAPDETGDPRDMTDALATPGETSSSIDNLDTGLENVYADEARADTINREAAEPAGMTDSGWQLSSSSGGSGSSFDGDMAFDATLASESTLCDYLTEQMHLAVADPAMRMIGAHLIGLVNEAGYLSGDIENVADTLGAPLELVEQTLAILQTFDPPGVMARNLKECLAIQLKERDRVDSERMQAALQKSGKHFLDAGIELVEHNQTVPGLVQLFNLLVAESISPDHPAHEFVKVDKGAGGDLAEDHHKTGLGGGFAGHAAARVLIQAGVQYRVADLVAEFIGVTFRHRFGAEFVTG